MSRVLIETDLIAEYLAAPIGEVPLLRRLLETSICFTTFIQASEIFSSAGNPEELRLVEQGLVGLKVLGAHGRYAKTIGTLLSSVGAHHDHRTAIVAAMAIESGLVLVTTRHFIAMRGIPGLRLVDANDLRRTANIEELLSSIDPG